jgi:hypothetical protein
MAHITDSSLRRVTHILLLPNHALQRTRRGRRSCNRRLPCVRSLSLGR